MYIVCRDFSVFTYTDSDVYRCTYKKSGHVGTPISGDYQYLLCKNKKKAGNWKAGKVRQ